MRYKLIDNNMSKEQQIKFHLEEIKYLDKAIKDAERSVRMAKIEISRIEREINILKLDR